MKNGDQPINPTFDSNSMTNQNGLTKREYFAAMAMQGLLANSGFQIDQDTDVSVSAQYAQSSIIYADELLKQLDR